MLMIITSCRKRIKALSYLLEDISNTDWDYPIIVTMDYEVVEGAGISESVPDRRSNLNFKLAIERAISYNVPWFVLLEDDSEINENIKHNIETWEPFLKNDIGCGGLSTNGGNRDSFGEGYSWYTPNSLLVYGLQGAIMTRDFAKLLIEKWEELPDNTDLKIARLAGKNIIGKYYKYWPSLVRHRHEIDSICNHGTIITDGFDKHFKNG